MLTCNINAKIGLFNGAIGRFVGPIYLEKKYCFSSFETFKDAAIDSFQYKTTRQINIHVSKKSVMLPIGTSLTEINQKVFDMDILKSLNESNFVSATFVLPKRPPFLPDCNVLNMEGYAERG